MEGVPDDVIIRAVEASGALQGSVPAKSGITKADLYELGLSGSAGSTQRRLRLLKELQLPQQLSSNALLDVLNCIIDLESLTAMVESWEEEYEA